MRATSPVRGDLGCVGRALPVGFARLEHVLAPVDLETDHAERFVLDPGLDGAKQHPQLSGVVTEGGRYEVDLPPLTQRDDPRLRELTGQSHGRGEVRDLEVNG